MKLFKVFLAVSLVGALLLSACRTTDEDRYAAWVKKELARDVQHDSLFLGLHFGMPRQAFFDTVWQLNRRKLVTHGPRTQSVQYKLPDVEPSTTLNFYPEFTSQGLINEVPVLIGRITYAPWLPNTSADSLIPEACEMIMDWYGGNEFQTFRFEGLPPLRIKIDGNRRIAVSREDEQYAKVLISDLSAVDQQKDGLFKVPQSHLVNRMP